MNGRLALVCSAGSSLKSSKESSKGNVLWPSVTVFAASVVPPVAPYDNTHLDSTRVCLDRESWSSSNAESEGARPSKVHTTRSSHSPDAGDNDAGYTNGTAKLQSPQVNVDHLRHCLSGQSERARLARLSRRKLTQEMQDLLAEQRGQESAAADFREQQGRPINRRLSSQDVRQGLHLRQASSSRPSSSNSSERTPGPALGRSANPSVPPPNEAWTARSYTRGTQLQPDSSRYDLPNNAVRPQTAGLSKQQRALQTEPYSFPGLREGRLGGASGRRLPSDESLHWLVGAEEAMSVQHTSRNYGSISHSRPQSQEAHRESPHIRSYPTHASPFPPFTQSFRGEIGSPESLSDQLTRSQHFSLAARSLQTQPFSLDAHSGLMYDPLYPQLAAQPPPLQVANPVSRQGSQVELLSSQVDMRLLSFDKKPIPGLPSDQESVKSQFSNPRSYGSSYDYKILAGKEPMSGASTLRKDYEADTEEEAGPKPVSRPSSKSASSTWARARQCSRMQSLQQVCLLACLCLLSASG